jgi:hypothetical protein
MKNTNTLKTTLVFASLAILSLMASCRKKTDEGETITTIKITLKKAGMADAVYTWKDLDGNGGANPILPDTIQLRSDSSYISKIEFLNESGSEVEDITEEVKTEGKEHYICYTASPNLVTVNHTDSDGTYSIGVESTWKATAKGKSSMRVVLRHQPGTKNGTCDPGEADVDVEFPIIVK